MCLCICWLYIEKIRGSEFRTDRLAGAMDQEMDIHSTLMVVSHQGLYQNNVTYFIFQWNHTLKYYYKLPYILAYKSTRDYQSKKLSKFFPLIVIRILYEYIWYVNLLQYNLWYFWLLFFCIHKYEICAYVGDLLETYLHKTSWMALNFCFALFLCLFVLSVVRCAVHGCWFCSQSEATEFVILL